jgi:hypothetical protein
MIVSRAKSVIRQATAIGLSFAALLATSLPLFAQSPPDVPRPPVVEGRWLRPSSSSPAVPRWGHAEGLQIGLAPLPGPRGLLRVYAPYLGHPESVVINYVAIEPIPRGRTERGLSELERSQLDGVSGKRLWSVDNLEDNAPRSPSSPARGIVEQADGVETLRVFVLSEPFGNGARVAVRLSFRADRPHEVGLATHRLDGSVELDRCILTATMGNYARLRRLHLADRVATPQELWPDFAGAGFTPHARFRLADLSRDPHGAALASATTDEPNPAEADYAFGTRRHWRYQGAKARQTWRVEIPDPRLEVLVNARRVYWSSLAPIPGGASFENFEMSSPFEEGGEFWFGVEPEQ